jgi:hypothetical protein
MKAQFIRGKWWVAYSGPVHLNGIRAPLIHVFVHFCCRLFLHTLSNRRLFVCVCWARWMVPQTPPIVLFWHSKSLTYVGRIKFK